MRRTWQMAFSLVFLAACGGGAPPEMLLALTFNPSQLTVSGGRCPCQVIAANSSGEDLTLVRLVVSDSSSGAEQQVFDQPGLQGLFGTISLAEASSLQGQLDLQPTHVLASGESASFAVNLIALNVSGDTTVIFSGGVTCRQP